MASLVDSETLKPIVVGQLVTDFRGKEFYVESFAAPKHIASTGRVQLRDPEQNFIHDVYPGVINAKFI